MGSKNVGSIGRRLLLVTIALAGLCGVYAYLRLRKKKKDEESSIENGREKNYEPPLPNVDSPTPLVDTDTETEDEEDPMEPVRGLQNLGNTCYFNSTMQAIAHTNFVFRDELETLHKKGEFILNVLKFYSAMQTENSAPYSSKELHRSFDKKSSTFADKKTPYSPNDLHRTFGKKSPKFADYRQHDSHECLRNFLDNIRKEERDNSGAADKRKVLTVVDSVFGGHFITVYICEECETPYHVCEALLDISLPIMIDEEDLAAIYSARGSKSREKSLTVKSQTQKSQIQHYASQTDDSNEGKLTKSPIDILTQSQSVEPDYKSSAVEKEIELKPTETGQDSKLDVTLHQIQAFPLESIQETSEIYAQPLTSGHEHDVSFAPNEPEARSIQEEATIVELENTSDGEIGKTVKENSLAILKIIDLDLEPGTFSLDDENENIEESKRTFGIETNLGEVCEAEESETLDEGNKEAKIPDKAKESTNVSDSETLDENVVNSSSYTNAESDLAEKNDTANDPSPSQGYSHEPTIPVETEEHKEREDHGWEKSDTRNPTKIREYNEEQEQSSEDQQHRQRKEQHRCGQHSDKTELIQQQRNTEQKEEHKDEEKDEGEQVQEHEEQDIGRPAQKYDNEDGDEEKEGVGEKDEDEDRIVVEEEGEEAKVVEQQTDAEYEEAKVEKGQDVEQAQEKHDDKHDDREKGKKEETEEDNEEEKDEVEDKESNVVEKQTDAEYVEKKVAEEVKVERELETEEQDVEQAHKKHDDEHDDKEKGKKEETEDYDEKKDEEEDKENNFVVQQADVKNEERKVVEEEVKEEEGQQNEGHEQDVGKLQLKEDDEHDDKEEGNNEETEVAAEKEKYKESVEKDKVAEERREETDKEENLQQKQDLEEEEFEAEKDASETTDPYREAVDKLMTPLSLSTPYLPNNEKAMKKHVTVDECLMYFTRKEDIHNEYLCNDCYGKHLEKGGTDVLLTSATKQTMIFNPPAILTLHLKRFELKPGGSVKRTDMITYGEFLDIAPYCSSMCLRNDPPYMNIWYSLYGVVVHHGSTLKSGHYTAYVKIKDNDPDLKKFLQEKYFDRDLSKEQLIEMMQEKQPGEANEQPDGINKHPGETNKQPGETRKQSGGTWYCMNDSWFDEVSVKTVLNQEAYLLFYERMS